jgi:3-hydroxymyristoyl/3-hydroxydecanoyl-(acyl carrier protein) dehydratase
MPVMPGAMILEAFVQAARHCLEAAGEGAPWVLHAVSQMRFNRFATPGDVLRMEVERDGEEDGAPRFRANARVGEEGVCRARFSVRRGEPL